MLLGHIVGDAFPAVHYAFLSEVDHDAEATVEKMEIGVHLRCKEGIVLFGCLALDDHLAIDKHIKAIGLSDFLAFVDHRHGFLSLDTESTQLQLMLQGVLVV